MFVISRNTAFTYKGRSINAKQISQELGVRCAGRKRSTVRQPAPRQCPADRCPDRGGNTAHRGGEVERCRSTRAMVLSSQSSRTTVLRSARLSHYPLYRRCGERGANARCPLSMGTPIRRPGPSPTLSRRRFWGSGSISLSGLSGSRRSRPPCSPRSGTRGRERPSSAYGTEALPRCGDGSRFKAWPN
jgi:hypothetical protein